MTRTGIVGGSALCAIDDLEITGRVRLKTPFGEPSDEFIVGELAGKNVVFLPRHGRSHNILPSEVNYRANIYAFKMLEVDRIVSVAAVGSLKEHIHPLDVLLVNQFIDRTNQSRRMTFFGEGIVAHIPFAEPVCAGLRKVILDSVRDIDVTVHDSGTYLNMEGPAFSTKAESLLYRSWGADVIGMTNLAEARLAREAGICYATIALVTDYDCWHSGQGMESVSVEMVLENVARNIETAGKIIKSTMANMPPPAPCSCHEALKGAIMTSADAIPQETIAKLGPIIKGYLNNHEIR